MVGDDQIGLLLDRVSQNRLSEVDAKQGAAQWPRWVTDEQANIVPVLAQAFWRQAAQYLKCVV